jgi:hypothetical protein
MEEKKRIRDESDWIEGLDEMDLQIARSIRDLPDLEPAATLLPSVMEALRGRKISLWRRLYAWATSPHAVTITPLRALPAGAFLVLLFFLAMWLLPGKRDPLVTRVSQQERASVVFTLALPGAHSVAVIGSFNGWNPRGFEMKFDETKKSWSITLPLPEGRHEYAYLVDGEKVVPDPGAVFFQEDGFGNRNSVLILKEKNGKDI